FARRVAERLGVAPDDLGVEQAEEDRTRWPEHVSRVSELLRTRTRDEWVELFDGSDACLTPVLDPLEALSHPHLATRGVFVEVHGVMPPAPAPRFDRTPSAIVRSPPMSGEHADEILLECGFSADEIAALRSTAIVA